VVGSRLQWRPGVVEQVHRSFRGRRERLAHAFNLSTTVVLATELMRGGVRVRLSDVNCTRTDPYGVSGPVGTMSSGVLPWNRLARARARPCSPTIPVTRPPA